jgi:membrane fusion protein, multidrug efflux system
MSRKYLIRWGMIGGAIVLGLVGCEKKPATQMMPPPEVTVGKPVQRDVTDYDEFTGRTRAVNLVNVTPRVSGYIVNIPFKEGDIVHKGDLLYQIDPRPYQAAYEQADGQLKQAQANQILQNTTFERQQRLQKTGVIAKEDYDTAVSNKAQAAAQVIASQAAVDSAQLNLGFTRVISPIDGRVSRQLVNIGNLVQADSTQLTTIVSIDPIYAYFSVDELAALKYQRQDKEGKMPSARGTGKDSVYLQLQDESGFPHEGMIDFADNTFDSSTGTILIRGAFPNSDGFLIPGAFVRVRVASSPKYQALLVADRAIGSDQGQSYVYVVDSKNTAHMRPIKTGQLSDGLRVVLSGLKPEDEIVINGIIKVRPESPVKPHQGDMTQFNSTELELNTTTTKANGKSSGANSSDKGKTPNNSH